MKSIIKNARKPEGLGGKILLKRMNGGTHEALAQWGLSYITPRQDAVALDIGCGGGGNITRLLSLCPEGTVRGVDYSATSVEMALKVNRRAVETGRCKVLQGDVSALPFEDNAFDLATAFETVYFWPEIENAFRQVLRVLKPGGIFLICNEADGARQPDERWADLVGGMTIYTREQLTQLLETAGFTDIKAQGAPEKHWLCLTAQKP